METLAAIIFMIFLVIWVFSLPAYLFTDNPIWIITAIFSVLGMMGMTSNTIAALERTQQEAIEAGVGEYFRNENNEKEFRFIPLESPVDAEPSEDPLANE